MAQIGYGERNGQQLRALDITAPLGTVVAGGAKHAPITACPGHVGIHKAAWM
jgi:DNA (cytosine-5)-methyltransferase 1